MKSPSSAKTLNRKSGQQEIACSHCRLPVPSSLHRPGRDVQFCCGGCEAVYGILHDCDLDEYYRLRDELGDTKRRPASVSGRDFEFFDDPEFLKQYTEPKTAGALLVRLYVEGVHCVACSWLIEKVLMEREGAKFARLDLGKSILEIVFDPAQIKLSRLAGVLDSIGYTPHAIQEDSLAQAARRETRNLVMRMGIAGASAGNIMLLAVSLYAGEFSGIEPAQANLFRWISLGLALPALLYSAAPFFRGAWSGLRHGLLHMDIPISLGILSAFLISFYATLLGRGEVYYDTLTILIFLLLAGRLLLNRATHWAAGSSEKLLDLEPRTARIIAEDGSREVSLTVIRAGDKLRVLPGEVIPVDGLLESDSAQVGEAHLTGEAAPVSKRSGDELFAGSTVERAPIELTATAVGETTRLARLARMMQEAAGRRAPIVAMHDRIAGYFVATVLLLALSTAGIWLMIDPSQALWNAAALLVITCPCALGLGTPVALAVAMGRAARRGLFVKGQDGIERLSKVSHVILDKTGTLTEGKLSLVKAYFTSTLPRSEEQPILESVAALEQVSGHAIASAFVNTHPGEQSVEEFVANTGAGIQGRVKGKEYRIGSENFVGELPKDIEEAAADANTRGLTAVFVARDGLVVAAIELGDVLRDESKGAIQQMKAQRLSLEILSGDSDAVVRNLGTQLGIGKSRGRIPPEAKLAHVEKLESAGIRTAMVGDGVNDAAALSRATAGISVAGATEIARDAADVFVSQRGPGAIADLFQLSRRAMRVVRLNIVIALCYNIIGASLAMAGLVSPLVAAILMPISSVTVLTIAVKG